MPRIGSKGAQSSQGFGQFAQSGAVNYIEDVFSTWLYTGTGASQTQTNNIDLANKGGLVWLKRRSSVESNYLQDSSTSFANSLVSNTTAAALVGSGIITSVSSTGFTTSSVSSGLTYASWTFRKQPKFFDIVTFTGTGSSGQTVAHNLQSVPAAIWIKRTDSAGNWAIYQKITGSSAGYTYWSLNSTASASNSITVPATSTTFTPYQVQSINGNDANINGATYVAYLFAHDAGGFGLTGTDNVISCGSFASASGTNFVTLGYEPQFILFKNIDAAEDWVLVDIARGMPISTGPRVLRPNTSGAETFAGATFPLFPTATGFGYTNFFSGPNTYIYIAIRRGPMRVPTAGTSVFGLSARSGNGSNDTVTGGQTDDAVLIKNRGSAVASLFSSRLTGTGYLVTSSTQAEVAAGTTILQNNPWDVMDGVKVGTTSTFTNASANTYINYLFKRAPSFMDVVCYTGTGSLQTQTHNLQAVPELMLFKRRSTPTNWFVYNSTSGPTKFMNLNSTASDVTETQPFNDTAPTSTVFTVNISSGTNAVGETYIAYLFATCAGVSKVGSYTGNGTTQTIDCGITAGARFVLIKRTDATGNWYVYDTARGMTVLTDPYWLTNTTAAEVATLGSVTTVSTGFALNSTILAAINVNAGTYIFLAIA